MRPNALGSTGVLALLALAAGCSKPPEQQLLPLGIASQPPWQWAGAAQPTTDEDAFDVLLNARQTLKAGYAPEQRRLLPEAVGPMLTNAHRLRQCRGFSGKTDKATADIFSGMATINVLTVTTYGVAMQKAADAALEASRPDDAIAASDALFVLGYYAAKNAESCNPAIALREALDLDAIEIRKRLSAAGAIHEPLSHWQDLSGQIEMEWRTQHDAILKRSQAQ